MYRGWGAYGGVAGLRYFRRCNGGGKLKKKKTVVKLKNKKKKTVAKLKKKKTVVKLKKKTSREATMVHERYLTM